MTPAVVNGAFHPDVVSSLDNIARFGIAGGSWLRALENFSCLTKRPLRTDDYICSVILYELASNIFWHSSGGVLALKFGLLKTGIGLEISATSLGSSLRFHNLLLDGWQIEQQRGRGLFSVIECSDEFSLVSIQQPKPQTKVISVVYGDKSICTTARPGKISISVPIPPLGGETAQKTAELARWTETSHFNAIRLRVLSRDPGPAGRYAEWLLDQNKN